MFNIRKIVNKTGRSLLALVLACSCMLGAIPSSAFAADTKNVKLREGLGTVSYGGYSTTKAKALDGWAYCLQPDAATPASGTYSATETNDDSLRAALWFATKGCGYDENLMPNKAWNGNNFGNTHLYAALHVLLARIYTGSIGTALSGVSAEFTTWFRQYFWGYDSNWEVLNKNAYWQKIKDRKDEVPSTFKVWIIKTGSATQNMIAYEYDTTPITIKKSSNNTSITNNNSMYSLKGAEFTVYDYDKTESDKCGDKVCVFVSDKNGDCTVSWPNEYEGEKYFDVVPGEKYRVKETNVPTGYIGMDAKDFTANKNKEVWDCDNTPQVVNVPNALLQKIDKDTLEPKKSDKYSLEDAIFKFSYYDADFSSYSTPAAAYAAAKANGTATKTWYMKTDSNSEIKFDSQHLVNGDKFYYDNNKNICIPLGTLFVEEDTATKYYNVSTEIVQWNFKYDKTAANKGNNITFGNTLKSIYKEKVYKGDFRLVKTATFADNEKTDEDTKNPVLVEGIKFEIYSLNDGTIFSPQFSSNISPGGLVCTITTDESGTASTKNEEVNGWSYSGRDDYLGSLGYGTYRVHEVIPDDVQEKFKEKYGVELYAADDFEFSISEKE